MRCPNGIFAPCFPILWVFITKALMVECGKFSALLRLYSTQERESACFEIMNTMNITNPK
ncbi:uncharacterized protein PHALS_14544 [Plasmopara halstedii]|uniref:Uncharacterized protein n=1 Tax=Plasmopara halstedii TaxID=4781 RepID=A0A0P1AL61_PLAHL|nr:uncharacterized protein PHALS_14544 [Plasmopara halstedii]CEG41604.1 hypothetical protein PHALS_14544 [Plasmopara halstedii]|eukprot:XP_024577973.1 hypothetical protein PHALS_14544 [Plasmopara halstedii]